MLVAAERIAAGLPAWEPVWQRYAGGWRAFPRMGDRLRLATLPVHRDLFTELSRYPKAPVAHLAKGRSTDRDFVPSHAEKDRPFNTALLRNVLKDEGWQVLGANDSGDVTGRAWIEFGDLDHYGHQHGLSLAREVPVILEAIIEQLRFLLDAGWKTIRIVTDHGWLLVPGGLPKTELAKFLTATRWGRCAALTDTADPTDLTLTWSWCPDARIAMAPDISSFVAGQEYGHGGMSLQESIIPVLRVSRPSGGGAAEDTPNARHTMGWTGPHKQ